MHDNKIDKLQNIQHGKLLFGPSTCGVYGAVTRDEVLHGVAGNFFDLVKPFVRDGCVALLVYLHDDLSNNLVLDT